MFDILFSGANVITMVDENKTILGCNVGVKDGLIAYVGAEPPAEPAKRTIDCGGKILMPGLINTHCHAAMTLLRGYADDYLLHEWLFEKMIPAENKMDERAVLAGARIAYAEMLQTGTTSFSDMYFCQPASAQLALECGIRASLCNGPTVFTPEEANFETNRGIIETKKLISDFHNAGGGRIRADLAIHAQYTSPPELWEYVMKLYRPGMVMHLHLSETNPEHIRCIEQTGKTPARVLYEAGVFDIPTLAAHCAWVSDSDMIIMREKGVSAAHNPVSNLKLASGIARVAAMLKAGVNVCLGTDGCSSNNTLDLFEELKLSALLQKGVTLDPLSVVAYDSLKMATVNGAKAQGRQGVVGQIKTGMEADIILIETDSVNILPVYNPIDAVVYSARGSDVCLTMVQGKILYENKEHTTIDIDFAKSEVKNYAVPRILS